MSSGFVHSVKVPKLYKETAKIVTEIKEQGGSLKQLLFKKKRHPNVKGIYALAFTTLQRSEHLDLIIRKTRILLENPRLDPWLARVLITELLWGKQKLPPGSKPIETIISYEKQLFDEAKSCVNDVGRLPPTKQVQKPRYVRVNTLKTTVDQMISSLTEQGWYCVNVKDDYKDYLKAIGDMQEWTFLRDIHIPELLVFPPGTEFHNWPEYQDGQLVLQDKASCLPSFLLNVPPGSAVFDMCAAPGMKTTHLAAIMQNQGTIYSNELKADRYHVLKEIVAKMDCSCVKPMNMDSLRLCDKQLPDVEYIVVDPTCSGSGMVERGKEECTPERITKLQSFQVFLLTHAMLAFPKVKRIVYSTCSINPEENEQVVDEVLGKVGDTYKLVPVKKLLKGKWINYSSLDYNCKDNCLYSRTETDRTTGFFVAVFERNPEVPLPTYTRMIQLEEKKMLRQQLKNDKKKWKFNSEDREDIQEYKKFKGNKVAKDAEDTILNGNVEEMDCKGNSEIDVNSMECSEPPSKKTKKKKNSKEEKDESTSMEIPEKLHLTDEMNENTVKDIEKGDKKKKKKDTKEAGENTVLQRGEKEQVINININVNIVNEISESEVLGDEKPRKIKKEKRRKHEEKSESATSKTTEEKPVDNEIDEITVDDVEKQDKKKKKKKRKQKEGTDAVAQDIEQEHATNSIPESEINEIIVKDVEEHNKKTKKRKRKHDETFAQDTEQEHVASGIPENEINEIIVKVGEEHNKKKKKRKRNQEEDKDIVKNVTNGMDELKNKRNKTGKLSIIEDVVLSRRLYY